jgi:hypothetical protein
MRWYKHVAYTGKIHVYTMFISKSPRKRPLVRPRRWWQDNIKIYCREIGCEFIGRIELVQNRVQRSAELTSSFKKSQHYTGI